MFGWARQRAHAAQVLNLQQQLADRDAFIRCCQQVLKANGTLTPKDWEYNRYGTDSSSFVDPVDPILAEKLTGDE